VKYLKLSVLYVNAALFFLLINNAPTTKTNSIIKSQPTKLELYMHDIAMRESDGYQRAKNQFGMLGLYQFSKTTLHALGYNRSAEEFLNNKHLQDTMMVKNLKVNYAILKPYIKHYNNKTFKGVRITTAGVLAAAHLGGAGSVISWFNDDTSEGLIDANGTSIKMYMVQFSKHGQIMGQL